MIEFAPNVVVGKKTADKDGYDAVVLGVYDKKKSRVTKPYGGQFPEGVAPTRILREMRDFEKEVAVGDKLGVAAPSRASASSTSARRARAAASRAS